MFIKKRSKVKSSIQILLLFVLLSLAGCQNNTPGGAGTPQNSIMEGTSSGNPSGMQNITFNQVFKSVFKESCVSCHDSNHAAEGIRYDSYQATIHSGELSQLAQSYKQYHEPASACQSISVENMDLVRKWIESGSPQ